MTFPALVDALWLPLLFVAGALIVGLREVATYRALARGADGDRIYHYGIARLIRRLGGAAVLIAVGVTLAAWEIVVASADAGAATPEWASRLVAALIVEVTLLVAIALADLRETARATRPCRACHSAPCACPAPRGTDRPTPRR